MLSFWECKGIWQLRDFTIKGVNIGEAGNVDRRMALAGDPFAQGKQPLSGSAFIYKKYCIP